MENSVNNSCPGFLLLMGEQSVVWIARLPGESGSYPSFISRINKLLAGANKHIFMTRTDHSA